MSRALANRKKRARELFDAAIRRQKTETKRYINTTAAEVYRKTSDDNQAIFAQQFTTVALAELFRFSYRETPWANGTLIDTDSAIDPGALAVTYFQLGGIGEAAIMADGAEDFPNVGLQGKQETNAVRTIGCSISWTNLEARTASLQKIFSIAEEKSAAAKKGYSVTKDFLVRFGAPEHRWAGVTNVPDSLLVASVGGWVAETITAANILADIRRMWNAVYNTTDTVETIDTIVFPSVVFAFVSTLQNSVASDITVLDYLKRAFPMIRNWEFDAGLNTADEAGTGPAILGYRKERSKLRVLEPEGLTPLPVEVRGTKNSIIFTARYAGIATMHPRSIVKMQGLA